MVGLKTTLKSKTKYNFYFLTIKHDNIIMFLPTQTVTKLRKYNKQGINTQNTTNFCLLTVLTVTSFLIHTIL